jgi:hypothetical protein
MIGNGGLRAFQFREYRHLWLLAVGLSLLMHARSFWQKHEEGDELAYVALAREMNWDLSHYTTRDDPVVSKFPYSIYRSSLFHHPPLFPLVLKYGQTLFGNPTLPGLIFENISICILLYYTWRWMVFQRMPACWGTIAFAGVTFCPLLLSSSVLLHHDALMGCYMTCGLVAYIEALQRPTVFRAIIAALLLTAGLNLRYNALIFLPILVALQVDNLYRREPTDAGGKTSPAIVPVATKSRWLVFGIVASFVLTFGLQHYYRILATYGSLLPSSFIRVDPDAANYSQFIRNVLERRPWKTALHLVLIYPILLSLLNPAIYAPVLRSLRNRSRNSLFTPIFLYLFAVEFYFSYSQVRYFATVTPCLFLSLPFLIREQSQRRREILAGIAAVSLMLMFATGFGKTQMSPADSMVIVPAPFFYLPPLRFIMY